MRLGANACASARMRAAKLSLTACVCWMFVQSILSASVVRISQRVCVRVHMNA